MNDAEIIDLYIRRDESAIQKTDVKYGHFCHMIALNILSIQEDAEECVSDTYLKAWDSIPPQKPDCFKVWLGKVVRNISLDLWRKNHRQKRYAGMEQQFDELEECLPAPSNVDAEIEKRELVDFLNHWLARLSKNDRILFMRRYWNGEALKDLADLYHTSPANVANRMYYLRKKLKAALEREGIVI